MALVDRNPNDLETKLRALAADSKTEYESIVTDMASLDTNDPAALSKFQMKYGQYQNVINFISTLTQKDLRMIKDIMDKL